MVELKLLKNSLENAPVIKKGKYEYFVNPLQGVSPPLKPELLREVAIGLVKRVDLDVDFIVGIEAMGIHLSAILSQITDIPTIILRKKKFGLPGEVEATIEKSYRRVAGGEEEKFYINSLKRGDKALIVDDVISSGGSLVAVIKSLEKIGVNIKDVAVVMKRGNKGSERVKKETGYEVKALSNIKIEGGKVHILNIL